MPSDKRNIDIHTGADRQTDKIKTAIHTQNRQTCHRHKYDRQTETARHTYIDINTGKTYRHTDRRKRHTTEIQTGRQTHIPEMQTQIQSDTDSQNDTEIHKYIQRHTANHTGNDTARHTDIQIARRTDKHTNINSDKNDGRQIYRNTNIHKHRLTDIHTYKNQSKQAGRQAGRQKQSWCSSCASLGTVRDCDDPTTSWGV